MSEYSLQPSGRKCLNQPDRRNIWSMSFCSLMETSLLCLLVYFLINNPKAACFPATLHSLNHSPLHSSLSNFLSVCVYLISRSYSLWLASTENIKVSSGFKSAICRGREPARVRNIGWIWVVWFLWAPPSRFCNCNFFINVLIFKWQILHRKLQSYSVRKLIHGLIQVKHLEPALNFYWAEPNEGHGPHIFIGCWSPLYLTEPVLCSGSAKRQRPQNPQVLPLKWF